MLFKIIVSQNCVWPEQAYLKNPQWITQIGDYFSAR